MKLKEKVVKNKTEKKSKGR